MANPFNIIRTRNTIGVAIVALILIVVINIIGAGKSDFFGLLNSLIAFAIAGLATALCWYYWSHLDKADPIERIWWLLGIGLGLWTVAEAIWNLLLLTVDEIPYPSIADLLWVGGYAFFFFPFFLLYRLLKTNPNPKILAPILGFAVIYIVVVTAYVIAPIVQDPGSSLLEKTLGALYPIGDLIITLGAIILALALMGGAFSWVWTSITVGFLSMSLSDILFTYADWNGLYMPDGSLNSLSLVIDMTYILGYVLIAIGIYIQLQYTVHDIEEPLVSRYKSVLITQNETYRTVKITLFTNAENNIISASPSMAYLLPSEKDLLDLDGMPFNQALGLEYESAQQLLEDTRRNGAISRRLIDLTAADNQPIKAQLSGIANFNESNRYIGSDIIITIPINEDKLVSGIKPEDLPAIGAEGGITAESPKEKLIATFFGGKIRALYIIVSRFGGIYVARSLQRTFNTNALHLGVDVRIDGPNIIFDSKTRDVTLYKELLRSTMNYASVVVSFDVLKREIEKWESQLDPSLIQAGKDAGIYGFRLDVKP